MWWLARPETALPGGTDWLTRRELDYAASRRFSKRRREFLVARFAAKCAVTRVLGWPATIARLRSVEIRHAPSGAPLAFVDGAAAQLRISLTDRAGWAVCGVSAAPGRIGCDLELAEPRSAAFVHDYFTEAERAFLASVPPAAGALGANLLWSAKESALKVLTTGLRRDTRSVEVTVGGLDGDGWQPLVVRAAEGTAMPGWWRRFGAFVLTTAGEAPAPEPEAVDERPHLADAVPTHTWLAAPLASGLR